MSPAGDLTIVVCTYNRAALLEEMLASLARSMGGSVGEAALLVVDNASADHTPAVAREAARHFRLRYLVEPKQGLSAARNRAVQEVDSGALWFLDDDVIVTPGWFPAVRRALAAYPHADWMGGRILPAWPARPPKWLMTGDRCHYKGMLVWYDQGPQDKPLAPPMPYFFGANLMFRRSIFDDGCRFDEGLGPLGRRPRLGDDVGFQSALHRQGRTARYVADAAVHHPVPPERMRLSYLLAWHLESGLAAVRTAGQADPPACWCGVPRYLYRQAAVNLLEGASSLAGGLLTARSVCWARGLARLALAAGKFVAIGQAVLASRTEEPDGASAAPGAPPLRPACKGG